MLDEFEMKRFWGGDHLLNTLYLRTSFQVASNGLLGMLCIGMVYEYACSKTTKRPNKASINICTSLVLFYHFLYVVKPRRDPNPDPA